VVELQAICQICLLSIDDGQGAIWGQPPPVGSDSGSREEVAWRVTHDECEHMTVGYRIGVERIRTWAAYLMSKEWIRDTNWDELALDSLNPTSTSTGGIRPLTLCDPGHRNIGD
jgi:hypothetical protein